MAMLVILPTPSCTIPVAEAPAPAPSPEPFHRVGDPEPFSGESRREDALQEFRETQRLQGEPSRVILNWLGNPHTALGIDEAAIRSFTAALELDNLPADRVSRGTVLMNSGNCPGAKADARAVLDQEPSTSQVVHTHAEAHVILANCHTLARDLAAALEHGEEAHATAKDHGNPEGRSRPWADSGSPSGRSGMAGFSQRMSVSDLPSSTQATGGGWRASHGCRTA